jgi:uncharacterized protein (TIGR02145 family)
MTIRHQPYFIHRSFLMMMMIILLCIYFGALNSCTKDEPRLMKVMNDSVADITVTNAVFWATAIDLGRGVDQYGHCWSVLEDFDLDHCENSTARSALVSTGPFFSSATGLTANTRYYVKAYLKKGNEIVYGSSKLYFNTLSMGTPVVSTTKATGISVTTITSGGNVISDGGSQVTARGVCWDITPNPDTTNNHTHDGTGNGVFVSLITGLTGNTTYYIRAYAANFSGTAYGGQDTVKTTAGTSIPSLSTSAVSEVTISSAKSGGYNISNGGEEILQKGVCWSTAHNPTISDGYTTNGSGNDSFVSLITGLSPGTPYYVRAYARNAKGYGYGNERGFSTPSESIIPFLTTSGVSEITTHTAKGGGSVTDDGGSEVTAKGLCWSKNTGPTIEDDTTNEGGGAGTFVSIMKNLEPSTLYHVRAYAVNAKGTGYGSDVTFTTKFECGYPFPDVRFGGESYPTILIGSQCWMAKNLNAGVMIDKNTEASDNGSIEKYCYDNSEINCTSYGALYPWNELMNYSNVESSKGICPDGWHIPSDEEWKVLEIDMGMTRAQVDSTGMRGTDEGTKLKAGGSSGFEVLMAGKLTVANQFESLGSYTTFWNSSGFNRTFSIYWSKIWRSSYVYDDMNTGLSVRCLKD